MSVPYDYDQTNIEHLRAVIAEQEATIEYLRECCKEKEAENAKLRELVRDMYKAFQRVFPDGHRLDFEMDMRELGVIE